MNKMKNKFIALLVVFTSITSFLPVEFSGQVADAATISANATAIQVYVDGSTTALTPTTTTTANETIYSTDSYQQNGFDVVLNNISKSESALIKEADTKKLTGSGTVSEIIEQKVEIMSINGISCSTTTGQAALNDLGIGITTANSPNASIDIVGEKITGLPLGVNNIEYKITITTEDVDYTAAVTTTDSSGKTTITTPATVTTNTPVQKSYANQPLTIYHGTKYVVDKISSMLFKAYTGSSADFDTTTDDVLDAYKKNNSSPFLYTKQVGPDSDMPLKYTFYVPDSTAALKYSMSFGESLSSGVTVYKNGAQAVDGSDYSVNGNILTGSLRTLGATDLIIVKINGNNSTDIIKTYAIQIKYDTLDAAQDYSLKDAGITKLDYANADTVEAYIGKKFTVTTDATNGFPVYTGDINIDSESRMISLEPTLRSTSSVAYVVTNNYTDSSGKTEVKKTELKNGKQFIDFMAGTSNVLQVDVYPGKNGNVTDSSVPLARYLLTVNTITGSKFTMNLGFESADTTYLTQPGVKANIIDAFTTSRYTYDLYSGDPVKVSFTGTRSTANEYLRVWLAEDVNTTSTTEAQASISNTLDSSYTRNTSIDVTLGTAKKMLVQAYYDEFETNTDGTIKTSTDGTPVYSSHAIGEKYVFYLPNNYDSTTTPTTGGSSTNALLNSLKLTGYTLTDSAGNSGFSGDQFDYTTTVAKDDTTAKIIAIAQDDNVQSIVATIDGGSVSYDLVSGVVSELPLNSSGTTTIKIVVTAQDGTTSATYNVVVTNNTKSSNVNLKNVILNVGDYTFDSTADTTKVRVNQNVTSITVTPVAEDSKSTVTVNGEDYSTSAISVDLKGAQKTEISITVTSEDGTASKTYTLEVYRVDASEWTTDSSSSTNDSTEVDQYYDDYNNCWVDTSKYDEWGSVNGKPVYFDKKSRQVKEAWISTGGKNYYLNNLGYRASGWKVDDADGKTYYLDPTTGEMKKGWMNLNNSWYYLGLNGVMHKGWLSLNQKWYYFTPNGQMVTNQSMFVDDKVYNFGQDGAIY
jgi:glucan-binding YG repeat protein